MTNAELLAYLIGAVGVMGGAIAFMYRLDRGTLKETLDIERGRNAKLDSENEEMFTMLRKIVAMLEMAEERGRLRREGER